MAGVTAPLIAPGWRRRAGWAGAVGLLVFLALAVLTYHGSRTRFDSWVFRELPRRIPAARAEVLIGFTDPAISVLTLALTVVLAVSLRRYALAALALTGPAAGTLLASAVIKPFIHRTMFGGHVGTYPSGHESGVTCTAVVLLLALVQLPIRRAAKVVLAVVLTVWVVTAAVGLTRFYYHYATDTIGAVGFSVAFVLVLAFAFDLVRERFAARRDARSTPVGPSSGPVARPRPRPGPGPARVAVNQRHEGHYSRGQLTPRS